MSKQRMINTDFWSDSWVVDSLNPLDRYLFVYLFTNSHTTIAGVYELSLRVMSFETGITANDLATMLTRLQPKVKYVDGWVVLRNGIKNQNYHSPKIKTGIDMALQKCPPELIELLKWPDDYESAKPQGSTQQQLIVEDLDNLFVQNNVVKTETVDKKPVEIKATSSPVKYGIDTLSHSNVNSNSNSKTVVRAQTAGTTGLKNRTGKSYMEVNILYEDLGSLVNDKFKAWYCSVFFKIGRERVMLLASQARADGKDPVKLFSHLLQKETGISKGAPAL